MQNYTINFKKGCFFIYHMRPLCCECRVSFTAVRYGVEHGIFHKNAHCSTDEGGEQVNVDVIACTVETPGESLCDKKKTKERKKFMKCESNLIMMLPSNGMVLLTAELIYHLADFTNFKNS